MPRISRELATASIVMVMSTAMKPEVRCTGRWVRRNATVDQPSSSTEIASNPIG